MVLDRGRTACQCFVRGGAVARPCRAKARLLLGRSRLPAVPPKCFLFTPERAPRSRGTSAQLARYPRFASVLWTLTCVKKTIHMTPRLLPKRWQRMTPEEREKFRQGFRGRCGPFEPRDAKPTA